MLQTIGQREGRRQKLFPIVQHVSIAILSETKRYEAKRSETRRDEAIFAYWKILMTHQYQKL